MSSQALALVNTQQPAQSLAVPLSLQEIRGYAELFAASGYFTDAKQLAQAAVKIIAGAECGLKPFDSINGIHMIQGKPSMGAHLLAKLVKMSARYDYKILEMTDDVCSIRFYEDGKELEPPSTFTKADATKAGTQNMTKFPRNMLFARAMSNGVRWHCPDVTAGPVYTPEELGAPVDEEGNYVPPAEPDRVTRTVKAEKVETVKEEAKEEKPEPKKPSPIRAKLLELLATATADNGITPTLQNVAQALHIEPGAAEASFWKSGRFVPIRLNNEQLYRFIHFANKGEAIAAETDVATVLEALKDELAAQEGE